MTKPVWCFPIVRVWLLNGAFHGMSWGSILHEPGSTKLSWINECIKVHHKTVQNLLVSFSIDDDGYFLKSIMSEIKVTNIDDKHSVALYNIYDEYCKLQAYWSDGVAVRASVSQLVDLGFIP